MMGSRAGVGVASVGEFNSHMTYTGSNEIST